MKLRTVAILLMMLPVTSAAYAQHVEVGATFGYTFSEGVSITPRPVLGVIYDGLGVDSGKSAGFTFGVYLSEQSQVEFLWNRQSSVLTGEGPVSDRPLSDLKIDNYMVNYVYNFGARESRVTPYAFAGIGATSFVFGDNLLNPGGPKIDGQTKFATNLGAGAKFYFGHNVGAKVGVRWTPTYIKSDPGGTWCDPFYGCWQMVDNDYANQFDTSFGITFRF